MKRTGNKHIFLPIVLLLFGCNASNDSKKTVNTPVSETVITEMPEKYIDSVIAGSLFPVPLIINDTEKKLISSGLVNIREIDTTIAVDLRYSTKNNFLGIDVYGEFNECYLQPDVAQKLKCAQEILRSKFSFYKLIIFDAVRSRSVQRKMWEIIDVPYSERSKYVSNPANGSLHNFGAAVDLSIIDEHGILLDMGTEYDYFGELAYPREEERMLEEGKLTHIQHLNRELLREVMEAAGFMGITTEWWHFNSCFRTEAYEKYTIIE